jgi:ABC-type branched-subunit amino acid transport system permease subunit
MNLRKFIPIIILSLIIILYPLVIRNQYFIHIAIVIGLSIIYGLGFNLLYGYCGQISFGHAAWYAIGAYTTALLTVRLGMPFWVSFPIAIIFSGVVGFLLGIPILRLRHHYLGMATLGFGIVIEAIIVQWRELTFGPVGVVGIPVPSFLFIPLSGVRYYYMVVFFTVCAFLVKRNLVRSRFGRALMAIRDNEDAAPSLGINPLIYKSMALGISGLYAGLAGVLYAHLHSYIGPECFGLSLSVDVVMVTVVGGLGTLIGPVIGGFIVSLLPEFLYRFVEYHLTIYAFILLIFLLFMPKGIAGMLEKGRMS